MVEAECKRPNGHLRDCLRGASVSPSEVNKITSIKTPDLGLEIRECYRNGLQFGFMFAKYPKIGLSAQGLSILAL